MEDAFRWLLHNAGYIIGTMVIIGVILTCARDIIADFWPFKWRPKWLDELDED